MAQHLHVDRGELADHEILGKPRDADDEADHGCQRDADDGHQQRVRETDDESAEVGAVVGVGHQRLGNVETCTFPEEIEAGCDAGFLEIGPRVVHEEGEQSDDCGQHEDLEHDAADLRIVEPGCTCTATRTLAGGGVRRSHLCQYPLARITPAFAGLSPVPPLVTHLAATIEPVGPQTLEIQALATRCLPFAGLFATRFSRFVLPAFL